MRILGISAFYHDSAAALIEDGHIIAAAQEERFTRIKHDPNFPEYAIRYCLKAANCSLQDIAYVVFYDKPLLKFERLLETHLAYAPKGLHSFVKSMPVWLKEKLFLKDTLRKALSALSDIKPSKLPPLLFTEHHQSHAASAFYPSPFKDAAVLCLDGVGEWATSSVWLGKGNQLTSQWTLDFPHSLGLLYSAFTYYTGFKVNSGEYKLMGLAPYGEPRYVRTILNHLLDIKDDGTFRLNMHYFNYAAGLTMTNDKFNDLFGGPPRSSEGLLTQREMDLARSIQVVTEEIILKIAKTVHKELGQENLCLAGGVALNCVANGRLLREGPFRDIWIQPAAGDAGGALGCALSTWYQYCKKPRTVATTDSMQGSYLGPAFSISEIEEALVPYKAVYTVLSEESLLEQLTRILEAGYVVGWFQGRMEFGPRALGARSIIGDARHTEMQSVMNLKIKYRESFRPFAPAVLAEHAADWFECEKDSPYMLLVANLKSDKCHTLTKAEQTLFGIDKLNIPRSKIPAVTHVDYSARIQTVHAETNPKFHALLTRFYEQTQCPVLINTSFNVRGEPIVCTPTDAYRCFMRTEMDYLVLDNVLLSKRQQPVWVESDNWRETFALD